MKFANYGRLPNTPVSPMGYPDAYEDEECCCWFFFMGEDYVVSGYKSDQLSFRASMALVNSSI
jgi:hypothetical protein